MNEQLRSTILAVLEGTNLYTPQVTERVNARGVKASITTVRKHLRALNREGRIVGQGALRAPLWGIDPYFSEARA